jgi:hypothetical protein
MNNFREDAYTDGSYEQHPIEYSDGSSHFYHPVVTRVLTAFGQNCSLPCAARSIVTAARPPLTTARPPFTAASPPSSLPGLPHRRSAAAAAWPSQAPPACGLPHLHPVVPGPAVAQSPLRVPGRPLPGPTAARCPPSSPCSVKAAASSTAPPAQPERTPPRQPIASARPERRPPRQRLPHDTPVPNLHCRSLTFIAGPIFSLLTG